MDLTDTQALYLQWKADPTRKGTKTQWAADHNVNITTLRAWEKTQWFEDGLTEAMSEMALGTDNLLQVVHSLQRAAAGGDMQAAKLYMAYLEKVNPTREAPREDRAVEKLTDEELELAWLEARVP